MSLVCREFVEVVTDYLEGALPEAERLEVDAHLRECRGCTAYLDQMRLAIRALGDPPPEPPDPEVRRRLLEAFATRGAGPPR